MKSLGKCETICNEMTCKRYNTIANKNLIEQNGAEHGTVIKCQRKPNNQPGAQQTAMASSTNQPMLINEQKTPKKRQQTKKTARSTFFIHFEIVPHRSNVKRCKLFRCDNRHRAARCGKFASCVNDYVIDKCIAASLR